MTLKQIIEQLPDPKVRELIDALSQNREHYIRHNDYMVGVCLTQNGLKDKVVIEKKNYWYLLKEKSCC